MSNTTTPGAGVATPIKAVLIDDEPLARMIVREYLEAWPEITIVQECGDGFEGIKAIQQHHPDLIFLDIQMPKINGFEMLELVEIPPAVIFTTAFDEYAIKAFESHAVDYLVKPFNKERFDKALGRWLTSRPMAGGSRASGGDSGSFSASGAGGAGESGVSGASGFYGGAGGTGSGEGAGSARANATRDLLETAALSPAQQQRVVVKTGGKIKIIPIEDILFLEAADDYVKIHTTGGAFLKNRTMSYFEKTLDPMQFVRTHRSYILNVQQVTRIEPYEKDSHLCILQSGAQVPVSKSGYVKLKGVLGL